MWFFKSMRGFVHPYLILVILVLGLAVGVYLVRQQTNFKPKADAVITFLDPDENPITVTYSPSVQVKLYSPFGVQTDNFEEEETEPETFLNNFIRPAQAQTNCSTSNLVRNGSFENPTIVNSKGNNQWQVYGYTNPDGATYGFTTELIPDWKKGAGASYQVELQKTGLFGTPYNGNQYAEIDVSYAITPTQTIPTQAGARYILKFAYAPRNEDIGEQRMGIYWNGQLVDTVLGTGRSGDPIRWNYYTYTVTANSSSSELGFKNSGGTSGAGNFLDDVSLTLDPSSCASVPSPTNSAPLYRTPPPSAPSSYVPQPVDNYYPQPSASSFPQASNEPQVPVSVYTTRAMISDDRNFTTNVELIYPYNKDPFILDYTFDPLPGFKTLYAKFVSNTGEQQIFSAKIELKREDVTEVKDDTEDSEDSEDPEATTKPQSSSKVTANRNTDDYDVLEDEEIDSTPKPSSRSTRSTPTPEPDSAAGSWQRMGDQNTPDPTTTPYYRSPSFERARETRDSVVYEGDKAQELLSHLEAEELQKPDQEIQDLSEEKPQESNFIKVIIDGVVHFISNLIK